MDHIDRDLNFRCQGGTTTRSAFKCHCLFVHYVNILTGNVLDSPINQLRLWSLSIPCLQALCKTAIYSICVICQLMDRHSLRNFKTSCGMKAQLRDGFQAHYLLFSKTDLSFSWFNITDSRCVICCIFGMRVRTELRFRAFEPFYYGKWRRWTRLQGF